MRNTLLALICCLLFTASAHAATQPAHQPQEKTYGQAAKILITKADRHMYLFDSAGNMIHEYKISLGKNPVGHKEREGDGKTPEGRYVINARNENSSYGLSLRISYPAPSDRQHAKRLGVSPGGDIFIHGPPNGKSWMTWKYSNKYDWTDGCVAVSDKEIRDIWHMVPDGTPVLILP